MPQRHRNALLAVGKISVRMKIAFQNGSLDHVTPWLKSLEKFLISLSMQKKLLPVVLSPECLGSLSFLSSACPPPPSVPPPATRHLHKLFPLTETLLNVEEKEVRKNGRRHR